MFKPANRKAIVRARQLRRDAPFPERNLWWKLRELKQLGFHFRRQAPFRSYILDFVEHNERLVIELDGGQHTVQKQRVRDARRDQMLASQGYRTLRFWNDEVIENIDSVMGVILRELQKRQDRPPPARLRANALRRTTSPQRER